MCVYSKRHLTEVSGLPCRRQQQCQLRSQLLRRASEGRAEIYPVLQMGKQGLPICTCYSHTDGIWSSHGGNPDSIVQACHFHKTKHSFWPAHNQVHWMTQAHVDWNEREKSLPFCQLSGARQQRAPLTRLMCLPSNHRGLFWEMTRITMCSVWQNAMCSGHTETVESESKPTVSTTGAWQALPYALRAPLTTIHLSVFAWAPTASHLLTWLC